MVCITHNDCAIFFAVAISYKTRIFEIEQFHRWPLEIITVRHILQFVWWTFLETIHEICTTEKTMHGRECKRWQLRLGNSCVPNAKHDSMYSADDEQTEKILTSSAKIRSLSKERSPRWFTYNRKRRRPIVKPLWNIAKSNTRVKNNSIYLHDDKVPSSSECLR